MGAGMRGGELLGVERRRRWTDEVKISILQEVGQSGWSVTGASAPPSNIPRCWHASSLDHGR